MHICIYKKTNYSIVHKTWNKEINMSLGIRLRLKEKISEISEQTYFQKVRVFIYKF